MITKRILFSSLIAQGIRNYKKKDHLFSTSKIFIKNGNLRFEDKHFNMDLYLFNPLITMKNLNSFMIKEDSFVLAFSFAHKISHSVQTPENSKFPQLESNHTFCLKYLQLAQILEVEPKSNAQSIIIREKMQDKRKKFKSLSVKDSPQQEQIIFTLKETFGNKQLGMKETPIQLQFHLSYIYHRIFKLLLKNSLFDLSGHKLACDIKRKEGIESLKKDMFLNRKEVHQQVEEYFNKMN